MKPVAFPLKLQMKRAEVGPLHEALSFLGFTIADEEKNNQRFGASTRAAVKQFQLAHKLPETGEVDQATATAINKELADRGVLDVEPGPGGGEVPPPNPPDEEPQPGDFYLVVGQVLRGDGPPIGQAMVRAWHKNLRSEIALGEPALSDDFGRYSIRYVLPQGVKQVDLVIRATDPDPDRQTEIAKSKLICRAKRREVVDLIAGGVEYRGYSEYERIAKAVQPHLDGVPVNELKVADVELLECKTHENPIYIAYLAIANQYAWTEVPAAVFYGFFRMGLPTSLVALVAQQARDQRRALLDALAANVIPRTLDAQINDILKKLKQISVELALEVPEGRKTISLAPLLETTGLSTAGQSTLLTRYSLYEGPIEEFWSSLKSDPDFAEPGLIEELQFTLQLGALAGGYVPLVQKLQERRKTGQFYGVAGLAALQHQDWVALVNEAGVPPGIPGQTAPQRVENYAKRLAQTVEVAFPTPSIVEGLKRANSSENEDLLRFFANNPDFTFESNIDRYLKNKGSVAVEGLLVATETVHQLKQMQRVYNVSPQDGRFNAMSSLLGAGVDSAQAIFRMGQDAFVRSFSGALGGAAGALSVYESAAQTTARTSSVFGQYSLALNVGTPAVIRNLTAQGAGVPEWESLFGSLSFCECEHCRSVYSPAAYFVDLLQFIKQQPAIRIVGGAVTYPIITLPDGSTRLKNALDVLFERRNDLGEIQLSCQNTNTLLPYIDLANEVLENAVVHQDNAFQTTWTSEELSANAEHQNDAAYARLAMQVYPRLMPFNLWLFEARTYLGHLKSSLVELMEVLHRPGLTGRPLAELEQQIAVESLGLSPGGAQIVTDPRQPPSEYWGVESTDWPGSLEDVSTFLRQAEIDYTTFEALRKTQFIGADGKLAVKFEAPCNIEGAKIENLTEPVLDRTHRFLRLQQATGWAIAELDAAITAMGAADLTKAFLVQTSQIKRLQGDLEKPLLEMLSWWSTVTTVVDDSDPEDRSFYDELFLNNAVLSPVDQVFQLNAARSDLENAGTAPLGEHKPTILSALAVTETDLELILNHTSKTESDTLTLELLSELYRQASFAGALELSVSDFVVIQKITGIDPFENPQAAIEFSAETQAIGLSKFTIATLDYLLRHVYSETSGLAPAESGIILVFDGIKAGLRAVAAENTFMSDPTGEITRGRLALLLTDDDLVEAISIIEGTSAQSQPDQEIFIDTHFASFLDVADAKDKLTGASAMTNPQARYEYVLAPLVDYLKTTLSTQVVVQGVAVALGLEAAVSEAILTRYVDTPGDPSKKAIDTFLNFDLEGEVYSATELDTYRLLHKIATVLANLKASADELVWVFEKGPSLGWLDLKNLPLAPSDGSAVFDRYRGWKRLLALYDFRDRHPAAGDVTVFSVLSLAETGSDRETLLGTLSSLTDWDAEDLDDLTGTNGFGLVFPADYTDERYLVYLQTAFDLLNRLGVAAAAAREWKIFDDIERMKEGATAVKSTVKAKYDNDAWIPIAEPLKNQLREAQRNALIAHLIARRPDIDEASDLFEHHLIDVEMNACMKTSRIKQAISSVQLFVQRSLMNLEPQVEITTLSAPQWEWMKNYRVWEANRKIFLYPENWILPELRDDKSPFFEELENDLLQNEITEETAETALLTYLEKLDEVANLDVRTLYHEKDTGEEPIDILHVFGRTRAHPHKYYYRTYVDSSYWTPWQRVPCDIQGDHLLAVVWNRRLYLIWPGFKESSDDSGTRWEIQLSWSEYRNGQWSAKRLAEDALEVPVESLSDNVVQTVTTRPTGPVRSLLGASRLSWARTPMGIGQTKDGDPVGPNIDIDSIELDDPDDGGTTQKSDSEDDPESITKLVLDPRGFVLKSEITSDDEMVVTCFLYTTTNFKYRQEIGTFRFSGCNGHVYPKLAIKSSESYLENVPNYCYAIGMQFAEAATGTEYPLFIRFEGNSADVSGDTVLEKTKDAFSLAVSHQYEEFTAQDKFFYQDDAAAFLVDPRHVRVFERAVNGLQNADAVSFELGYNSWSSNINVVSAEATSLTAATYQMGTVNAPEEKTYGFTNAYHPYVCEFIKTLNRNGIDGLMQRSLQMIGEQSAGASFESVYEPVAGIVKLAYPEKTVDFTERGAYSAYNWELFFHAPLLIAIRLSANQRFEDAQRWFHYIFNPTARLDSAEVTGPERYWNFLPFYEENEPQTIDELMLALNQGDAELEAQVEAWRITPFNPHLIARMRPIAYQKTVVMKYLDNLIAWGDNLFRQDTIESINEATQLYVLAANILGSPPQSLPSDQVKDSETYNTLAGKLDDFSNALVQIENQVPAIKRPTFDPWDDLFPIPPILFPHPVPRPSPSFETLYFCVPKNDELCGYWDTVADRLFKIRNCMNIEGVVRELALFEQPINPALLVQAAAAGIDISSVLSDLYAPLPRYRFQVMAQKTMEFCGDVRSLGAALISALEKQDGEALALLRAGHESQILESARQIREQQISDAQEALAALEKSKAMAEARRDYYSNREYTNPSEKLQQTLLTTSLVLQGVAQLTEMTASFVHGVPDAYAGGAGVYGSPLAFSHAGGGSKAGAGLQSFSRAMSGLASIAGTGSSLAAGKGGFDRRAEEWAFQAEMAEKEIAQIDKQIAAAQIRVAITEQELTNHNKQIEHTREVHDFMTNKYTNDKLYSWMVSQISSIYFQSYQMAYDLAKRAEKAYQHELGLSSSSFITFGYWDSLKKGLLSGDKLQYDLRRMEMSYLDQNKREYELTKHVSLSLLDPEALLRLTTEGECDFSLHEAVYDLDSPGHYMRRIRGVSVSIPCVTGPYTSVNCTLTLTSDKSRRDTSTASGYAYTGPEDTRFHHNYIAESISTSSAQNDSGVFELNFRDERYLPFEGRGVIGDWNLKLAGAVPTFDWSTITDVVVHIHYTAQEGGEALRTAAINALTEELKNIPLRRGFSSKHEFPTAWSAFSRPSLNGNGAALNLDLSEKRFPYFARHLGLKISDLQLVALVKDSANFRDVTVDVEYNGTAHDGVVLTSADGLYNGNPSANIEYPEADPGEWKITVDSTTLGAPSEWLDDLIVLATYQVTVPSESASI